jgi:Mg-chelatase subunit ChlD
MKHQLTLRSGWRTGTEFRLNMKAMLSFIMLATLSAGAAAPARAVAAQEEGVALAIVYDTSGSMQQPVKDADGTRSPKYVIARRALQSIVQRLQAFVASAPAGTPRKMEAGLFVFSGNEARELVKMGAFDGKNLDRWTSDLPPPSAGTPLGKALETATRAVLDSPLSRKHVLVVTDGENTVGPKPDAVLPGLKRQAEKSQTRLNVHFVAFDVDAKVFEPLKRMGVTVVGAANETQLNDQLGFILEKKILLEDEEPPAKPKTN